LIEPGSASAIASSPRTLHPADARDADCKAGTVFYLYTPFSGSILRVCSIGLRHEASTRTFRVCTYGRARKLSRGAMLKSRARATSAADHVFATRAASSTSNPLPEWILERLMCELALTRLVSA